MIWQNCNTTWMIGMNSCSSCWLRDSFDESIDLWTEQWNDKQKQQKSTNWMRQRKNVDKRQNQTELCLTSWVIHKILQQTFFSSGTKIEESVIHQFEMDRNGKKAADRKRKLKLKVKKTDGEKTGKFRAQFSCAFVKCYIEWWFCRL